MCCDCCYLEEGIYVNKEWVDQVMGFGIDCYIEMDGLGKMWCLDQVVIDEGEIMVFIGYQLLEKF